MFKKMSVETKEKDNQYFGNTHAFSPVHILFLVPCDYFS